MLGVYYRNESEERKREIEREMLQLELDFMAIVAIFESSSCNEFFF